MVYDRATSKSTGLFKRFNLSLVANPTINGKMATETMADGQQLFIQTLLPMNAITNAAYGAGNLNPIAQLEPTQYVFTVQDPTLPVDTRFLQVLQAANPGVAMAQAAYIRSTSGTAFDGAAVGNAAVYFPQSAGTAFTSATFAAPSGVHTMLVAGLKPATGYGVTIQPSGSGISMISVNTTGATATTDR